MAQAHSAHSEMAVVLMVECSLVAQNEPSRHHDSSCHDQRHEVVPSSLLDHLVFVESTAAGSHNCSEDTESIASSNALRISDFGIAQAEAAAVEDLEWSFLAPLPAYFPHLALRL